MAQAQHTQWNAKLVGDSSFGSGSSRVCELQLMDWAGRPAIQKKLLPKFQGRPEYEELLRGEYEVLSGLDHPLIRKPLFLNKETAFHSTETWSLGLEYCEAQSLADLIPYVLSLPPERRKAWVSSMTSQLLEVFRYLHEKKEVVHGDLAPENILVCEDGSIRIIDFGLSSSPDWRHSASFRIAGRLTYRSPEMIESGRPSKSADLYALAKIIEELSDGQSASLEVVECLVKEQKIPDRQLPLTFDCGFDDLKSSAAFSARSDSQFEPTRLSKAWRWAVLPLGFAALLVSSFNPVYTLSLNTLPYSEVYCGDHFLGETPLLGRELSLTSCAQLRLVVPQQDHQVFERHISAGSSESLNHFEDFRNIDRLDE